jgi:hypothetical protein
MISLQPRASSLVATATLSLQPRQAIAYRHAGHTRDEISTPYSFHLPPNAVANPKSCARELHVNSTPKTKRTNHHSLPVVPQIMAGHVSCGMVKTSTLASQVRFLLMTA